MGIAILFGLIVFASLGVVISSLWTLTVNKDVEQRKQSKKRLIVSLLIAMVGYGTCGFIFSGIGT